MGTPIHSKCSLLGTNFLVFVSPPDFFHSVKIAKKTLLADCETKSPNSGLIFLNGIAIATIIIWIWQSACRPHKEINTQGF